MNHPPAVADCARFQGVRPRRCPNTAVTRRYGHRAIPSQISNFCGIPCASPTYRLRSGVPVVGMGACVVIAAAGNAEQFLWFADRVRRPTSDRGGGDASDG